MNRQDKPSKETLEQWHNDPANWKLGLFYYNKADRRLFPPKRFKTLGWTVNFANPYSYLTLLAIIAAFETLVFFIVKQ